MESPVVAKPVNPKLTAFHFACAARTGQSPEFFLVEDNAAVVSKDMRKQLADRMTPGSKGQATILQGV